MEHPACDGGPVAFSRWCADGPTHRTTQPRGHPLWGEWLGHLGMRVLLCTNTGTTGIGGHLYTVAAHAEALGACVECSVVGIGSARSPALDALGCRVHHIYFGRNRTRLPELRQSMASVRSEKPVRHCIRLTQRLNAAGHPVQLVLVGHAHDHRIRDELATELGPHGTIVSCPVVKVRRRRRSVDWAFALGWPPDRVWPRECRAGGRQQGHESRSRGDAADGWCFPWAGGWSRRGRG